MSNRVIEDRVGVAAAVAIRRRSTAVRLVAMAVIALLIGLVGHWPYAGVWWALYAVIQGVMLYVERRTSRWGFGPVYAASFLTFAIAGAPSLYMWTHAGALGIAAASMFLSGMLAQIVAWSMAARKLFYASAAPLFGYMVAAPALYFGPSHPQELIGALACPLLLAGYLTVVLRAQQAAISAVEHSRQDAEAASRAKGEFLALISHEIRTPLNAVLGAADLLERSRLSAEQRRLVELLRHGGALLRQILDDLLDLSEIQAGRLSVEPVDTELHELVRRCAEIWRPRVQEAGLEFRLRIDPSAPHRVRLDPTRTEQILFHLMANALKFTERGRITLGLDLARLTEREAEIVLSVADTGIGMSQEVLDRLFVPFEQGDRSITRRFGGAGLGLAISQRLAAMMGGGISAESVVGGGSVFRVKLPAPLVAEPEAPLAA